MSFSKKTICHLYLSSQVGRTEAQSSLLSLQIYHSLKHRPLCTLHGFFHSAFSIAWNPTGTAVDDFQWFFWLILTSKRLYSYTYIYTNTIHHFSNPFQNPSPQLLCPPSTPGSIRLIGCPQSIGPSGTSLLELLFRFLIA